MTMLRVSVWRGGESGALPEFEVPRPPSQTVLEFSDKRAVAKPAWKGGL